MIVFSVASTVTVSVMIIGDSTVEGDEWFIGRLRGTANDGVILTTDTINVTMKALKCKTSAEFICRSHMHIHYTSVVYTAHARASASLPLVGLRLYLACFTPVAPVASL